MNDSLLFSIKMVVDHWRAFNFQNRQELLVSSFPKHPVYNWPMKMASKLTDFPSHFFVELKYQRVIIFFQQKSYFMICRHRITPPNKTIGFEKSYFLQEIFDF